MGSKHVTCICYYRKPDKNEVEEPLEPCPKCEYLLPQTKLDCPQCKNTLPYCIITVSNIDYFSKVCNLKNSY